MAQIPILTARNAELEAQVLTLEARIIDLEVRLAQHSGTSSKPPAAAPPEAPPPPPAPPRGRQRGGQSGHPPHQRPLLPPDEVTQLHLLAPERCQHCTTTRDPALPDARPPLRHQVWEIPSQRPTVPEYQQRALACPLCATITRAALPSGVPTGICSPRALAIIGLLHGRYQLSDRETGQALHDLFGLPLSLGMITRVEATLTAALEPSYAEVAQVVAAADRAWVDATGWKHGTAGIAGKRRGWLWTVVTPQATRFQIHPGRGRSAVTALMGAAWDGVLTSDRCSASNGHRLAQRQVC